MRGILDLTYWGYIRYVIFRIVPVFVIALIIPSYLYINMDEGLLRLTLVVIATIVELPVLVFAIGLNLTERVAILDFVKKKLLKR